MIVQLHVIQPKSLTKSLKFRAPYWDKLNLSIIMIISSLLQEHNSSSTLELQRPQCRGFQLIDNK